MAVSTKHYKSDDLDVHAVKVNRSNKKGVTNLIGGQLHLESDGDFHIVLKTKVNGKPRTVQVGPGEWVFWTGSKKTRWQVASNAGFLKRFKNLQHA